MTETVTALGLDADLAVDLGTLALRATFAVAPGETVAMLGPNGAGKTSILRALAGLLPIASGHVRLGGRTLDGGATGGWVPPEDRPVGLVFQDHLLFPHLSAADNVAFGLRTRRRPRVSREEARRQAREWLERLGLGPVAAAKPGALSGGQAQRVALARTLILRPDLLLLDEPLSALDATTRASTRRELRRVLDGYDGACVVVTHDVVDAMAVADRLLILEGGRIVQQGPPDDVVARPRSPFAADLVGVNLLPGSATAGTVRLSTARLDVATTSPEEGDVLVLIHPRAVTLHRERPLGSSSRNVWPGRVRGIDVGDGRARVRVEVGGADPATLLVAEVTPAAVRELGLTEDVEVWASVKATEVEVYGR